MVFNHATGVADCAKHWHRSIEICCFINTRVKLWRNGNYYSIDPDSLIIINSGEVHELIPEDNPSPHGVSLIFPFEFLEKMEIDITKISFLFTAGEEKDCELREAMHRVSNLLENANDKHGYLLINSAIFQILYFLITYYSVPKPKETIISTQNLERCKQILSFIDDNYQSDITLETLAKQINISVSYLSRYFRKYLGVTFKTHLTSIRLQHAIQEMLQESDGRSFSLLEVAQNNGFPDYRSFVSAFRTWYHMYPNEYRISRLRLLNKGKLDNSRTEMVFAKHLSLKDPMGNSMLQED